MVVKMRRTTRRTMSRPNLKKRLDRIERELDDTLRASPRQWALTTDFHETVAWQVMRKSIEEYWAKEGTL